MKKVAFLTALLVTLLVIGFARSQAEVVGRFTQVEGRVDLLKGGNLPATPVTVNTTVEPQDVVRTKSLSKAQITFIDNSMLTISPRSRIAIAEYMIEPAQGKRRAVLEIFQGMALAVVNKIFNVKEPDFVVKTHTAIMGVRGTEFGVRLLPNSSTVMNFKGLLQVGNVFPEIGQLFQKAFKVAYAFGPPGNQSGHWVFLKAMQATTVARDLPPTLPYGISIQDREMFMRQLTTIAPQTSSKVFQGGDQGYTAAKSVSPETSVTPVSTTSTPGEQTALASLTTIYVPPVVTNIVQQTPIVQPTPTTTYSFTQNYSGAYLLTSAAPYTVGVFASTGQGSGSRTGVYPGNFTANYNFSAVWDNSGMKWTPSYKGLFEITMTGQVTGTLGQTLSGNMQMTLTDSPNGGQFQVSGPVSISPSGEVISHFTGTGVAYPNMDGMQVTEGTITQTPATTGASESTTPVALTASKSPSTPVASPTSASATEVAVAASTAPATTPTPTSTVVPVTSQVSAPKVTQAVKSAVSLVPSPQVAATPAPAVAAVASPVSVVTATATPKIAPQVSPTTAPAAVSTVAPATTPVASQATNPPGSK